MYFVSPVPLLGFLLQARQQSVQTVVVAVQQPRRQLAEVSVVLLVEERKGQVTPRPDVVQNKSEHVFFHHPLELRHEPGEQLHSDLPQQIETTQSLGKKNKEINHAVITYMGHATLSNRLL